MEGFENVESFEELELEKQGYLKKTQTCQRVGGLTNYYELTTEKSIFFLPVVC
jgi:hypothetical protein